MTREEPGDVPTDANHDAAFRVTALDFDNHVWELLCRETYIVLVKQLLVTVLFSNVSVPYSSSGLSTHNTGRYLLSLSKGSVVSIINKNKPRSC